MVALFSVLNLAASIAVIISVIMQEGASEGLGAVGGASANSLFGSTRGNSKEEILKRITVVASVVFIISSLALTAI